MFSDYGNAVASTWRLSLAEYEYSQFDNSHRYSWWYQVVWFASLGVLGLILLNTLIAMMAHTFSQVYANVVLESRMAKAKVIEQCELSMPSKRLEMLYSTAFMGKHEIVDTQDTDAAENLQEQVNLQDLNNRLISLETLIAERLPENSGSDVTPLWKGTRKFPQRPGERESPLS